MTPRSPRNLTRAFNCAYVHTVQEAVGAMADVSAAMARNGELSRRTFCAFSREFSSFTRHGMANGQRP